MRKLTLLAAVVVIGAGLAIWLWSKGTPANLGAFSSHDFAQIQQAVWQAARQVALSPSLSKTNQSAASLGLLATGRILYVEPYPPRKSSDPETGPTNAAHVRARFLFGERYFLLRKQLDATGIETWCVVAQSSSTLAYPKPLIVRVVDGTRSLPVEPGETNLVRSEQEFSKWLSRSADLKLGR